MKVLFIGGTGTISMAISRLLLSSGHDLTLLNRGSRTSELPSSDNLHIINVDINDEDKVKALLEGQTFDSVCDSLVLYLRRLSVTSDFSRALPSSICISLPPLLTINRDATM